MSLPSAKELKKLAAACRKAGIKHFKTGEIEFTLTDVEPTSYPKMKAARSQEPLPNQDSPVRVQDSWDDLSENDKLFWSAPVTEEAI